MKNGPQCHRAGAMFVLYLLRIELTFVHISHELFLVSSYMYVNLMHKNYDDIYQIFLYTHFINFKHKAYKMFMYSCFSNVYFVHWYPEWFMWLMLLFYWTKIHESDSWRS